MTARDGPIPDLREQGMILINVLVMVMLATTVLAIMLSGRDSTLERNIRLRNAAQAMAVLQGGELSAVAALRRDLAQGNSSDNLAELWANIADANVAIDGGRFTFAASDAQAKFNINSLLQRDAISRASFTEIVSAVDLPVDVVPKVIDLLALGGPIDDLNALQVAGIDPPALRRLAEFCTVLPKPTGVNLNTASEGLIAILLGNAAAARTVVSMRARAGGLSFQTMSAAKILLQPGTTIRSDYFWARGRVTMGDTTQQLSSLLVRGTADGKPQVIAIRRWRGPPPLQAPPLPV